MQYRPLGRTGIDVSVICLGTMTFGEQNDQAQAHEQLDHAVASGVNFIDTAELYPVPAGAATYARTEEIIGHWLAGREDRDRLVIATKVAGPGDGLSYMRDGPMALDRRNIRLALEASLRRLQTDYVDLYQLHWPERPSNYFGKLGYPCTGNEPQGTPITETLEALAEQVEAGRVRHIGLSNETPWGLMRFVEAAERLDLPRVVSIQNPYSLLNRSFEVGLAECAVRESVGLLAYSALGFGVLSGKYLDGSAPADARLNLEMFSAFTRYSNEPGLQATRDYVQLAREHSLDPAQMALAFVHSRPFLTSTIIGATTMAQLQSNLDSIELALTPEVLDGIDAIHQRWSNPCP